MSVALRVGVGRRAYDRAMLTVGETAQRVGRSPSTVRRWSREGRLQADVVDRKLLIDPDALDELRDAIFPTLPLPPEWRTLGAGPELGGRSSAVADRALRRCR